MKKKTKPKTANKKKPKPAKAKKQTRIEKLEAIVSELSIRLAAVEKALNTVEPKPQPSSPVNPWPWPYNPNPSWTWKDWPIYYNYCGKKYS